MEPSPQSDPWSHLLNAFTDELMTPEQELELERLLRSDSLFRRSFVLHCQLVSQLTWQCASLPVSADESQIRARGGSWRRSGRSLPSWIKVLPRLARSPLSWVSALMILITASWLVFFVNAEVERVVLTDVVGQITIMRAGKPAIVVRGDNHAPPSVQIHLGDHVQTDRTSSGKLTLADGSSVRLRPDSELVVSGDTSKVMVLRQGSMAAQVARQTSDRSLTFMTPLADVRVLGTELEILASSKRTEVVVEEGKVRVTRVSDKISNDVAQGQFLAVSETGPLSVMNLPQPADSWGEDFEQGLPKGWRARFVRVGLPAGSTGAVAARSAQVVSEPILEIGSPLLETGLFAWHADTLLHLTYRLEPPGWFHIFLIARSFEQPEPELMYCYIDPDLWRVSGGEWRTASVPLSAFRRLSDTSVEPSLVRIPVQISLRGQSSSGFAVDRIWVDRGNSNAQ